MITICFIAGKQEAIFCQSKKIRKFRKTLYRFCSTVTSCTVFPSNCFFKFQPFLNAFYIPVFEIYIIYFAIHAFHFGIYEILTVARRCAEVKYVSLENSNIQRHNKSKSQKYNRYFSSFKSFSKFKIIVKTIIIKYIKTSQLFYLLSFQC